MQEQAMRNDQLSQNIQLSIEDHSARNIRMEATVGEIQEALADQQAQHSNIRDSIVHLENHNSSLTSDMKIVMMMLQKMDSTLTSISTNEGPPPQTSRYGEASHNRHSEC